MKVQLITLLCALSSAWNTPVIAQVAYTWVDKDGVIHFSDTPRQGAKAIALPNLEASPPAPEVESTESLAPQVNKALDEAQETPQTQPEQPDSYPSF